MTAALVAVVAVGAVTSAALTDRAPRLSRVAKMVASTAAVGVLGATVESWDPYAIGVLVALVCSWVGDLALSYEGRRAFVVGLAAFAAAHIAYIVAFGVRDGLDRTWLVAGAAFMAVVGSATLRWLRPHRPPELAAALTAYVVVIAAMVAMAFSSHGAQPDTRILLGAVAFATSDILVARQRFVVRSRANRMLGLPMYYLAQVLFALSA